MPQQRPDEAARWGNRGVPEDAIISAISTHHHVWTSRAERLYGSVLKIWAAKPT